MIIDDQHVISLLVVLILTLIGILILSMFYICSEINRSNQKAILLKNINNNYKKSDKKSAY